GVRFLFRGLLGPVLKPLLESHRSLFQFSFRRAARGALADLITKVDSKHTPARSYRTTCSATDRRESFPEPRVVYGLKGTWGCADMGWPIANVTPSRERQ